MAKATVARIRRSKSGRTGKAMTAPRVSLARSNGGALKPTFGERKSIEQLAREQRVQLQGQFERILGAGAELWATHAEFDRRSEVTEAR